MPELPYDCPFLDAAVQPIPEDHRMLVIKIQVAVKLAPKKPSFQVPSDSEKNDDTLTMTMVDIGAIWATLNQILFFDLNQPEDINVFTVHKQLLLLAKKVKELNDQHSYNKL